MSCAKVGWFVVTLCVALARSAAAQTAPVTVSPPPADPDHDFQRWYHLQWPTFGGRVTYSFNTLPTPGYEMLSWPTYQWTTSLALSPALTLNWFNRVQPAIELNCLSTLCQPMLEKTYGLEGHLNLGGSALLPDNHLFVRYGSVLDALRGFRRFKVGVSGLW